MKVKNVLISTSSFGKSDSKPLEQMLKLGLNVIINPFGRKLTENEIEELIKEHQPVGMIAGVEPLTERVLKKTNGLKVISRCGIGMDSVDLKFAEKLGIAVTNTPDAPTIPVAELTLGIILGLLREIHVSDASIRNNGWERPMGRLLYGKTVGIIGCGRIGSRLANILKGFECNIIGHDPVNIDCPNVQIIDLDAVLKKSDIISLHIPYSIQTHHFINSERLRMMKKDAYLVNAARGGLVDEPGLYQALINEQLAGAALDCFEDEPYQGPLKELKNVLITAHIGSYAQEGRIMMESQAAENLIQLLKKQEIIK